MYSRGVRFTWHDCNEKQQILYINPSLIALTIETQIVTMFSITLVSIFYINVLNAAFALGARPEHLFEKKKAIPQQEALIR